MENEFPPGEPDIMKSMESLVRRFLLAVAALVVAPLTGAALFAQAAQQHVGGEANLVVPDLGTAEFMGFNGRTLLMFGIGICFLGLIFGLVIYNQLKNMPVHKSMLEVSELIYETCKTYLITQGKFILILEVLIGTVIALYFGVLQHMTFT